MMKLCLMMTLGVIVLTACHDQTTPPQAVSTKINMHRPAQVQSDGYVTSASCRDCHADQYDSWRGSYHSRMTQIATPDTVVAPFPSRIEYKNVTCQLRRESDLYFADITETGETITRQIVLTTGSHHMQVYWMATGRSRELQPMPFVWLINEQRWTPRNAVFLRPPIADRGPEIGRWNSTCIKCHTTLGQPRYLSEHVMDTRVAEFGIACEACHGPGDIHVKDELTSSIVQPDYLMHRRASQVCGQCHSVNIFADEKTGESWNAHGLNYRPGDELAHSLHVIRGGDEKTHVKTKAILKDRPYYLEDRFWPDGMVRVSGREYNGLIESPCYQQGEMTCMSCHQMHQPAGDHRALKVWADDQLKPGMSGDKACLQCHKTYAEDIEKHTHHLQNSSGSRCMNCHMPHTTYGLLKAIRSHTVSSPSLRESTEYGRPNACNQCHLDKTLGWTGEHLQKWYGHEVPTLTDDQKTIAATALWLISGDAGQRALAAWSCGYSESRQASDTSWLKPYLTQLLIDPYDAVRFIAHRSLRTLPGMEQLDYDYMASQSRRSQVAHKIMAALKPDEDTVKLIVRLLEQRDNRLVGLQE